MDVQTITFIISRLYYKYQSIFGATTIFIKREVLNVIVDFGASQNHTHHKESIYSFADLFNAKNLDLEVWIPFGSEIDHKNLPVKNYLLPGFNPISLDLSKPSTWISAVHGKIHNFSNTHNFRYFLKILAYLNSLNFLLLILYKKLYYKNIKITFTTMCAFSFRSLYMLETCKVNIDSYCRLTNTSERRGKLSDLFSSKNFIQISRKFKHVTVRFGIETSAYLAKIGLETDDRGFISKFPSRNNLQQKKLDISNITISFLGFPTKNKGQHHILPLVKNISQERPTINWQIQLIEKDKLITEISQIHSSIKILEGKISPNSMELALSDSSLLCLPYDVKAFEYNSSAMMYQAMDYLVPVLTFSGSAFAEDVTKFNCGLVANDKEDMIDKLSIIDFNEINAWIEGCKKYNDYRSKSNHIFLEI
jgi:glycosyltransferase involved in cell wall biosynthesis